MSRKTKEDWFLSSIDILAESGSTGLIIDALTSRLGVTKGSFYHHFGSYAQFKKELLIYFQKEGTLGIITETEKVDDPHEKLRRLVDIIVTESARQPVNIEVAMRAWALEDDEVYQWLKGVDEQRISYVKMLCTQISGETSQGLLMAEMIYAILVGSEQIIPPLSPNRLKLLYDEFMRLYGIKSR
jgi:AcrR family transcriptional regulator